MLKNLFGHDDRRLPADNVIVTVVQVNDDVANPTPEEVAEWAAPWADAVVSARSPGARRVAEAIADVAGLAVIEQAEFGDDPTNVTGDAGRVFLRGLDDLRMTLAGRKVVVAASGSVTLAGLRELLTDEELEESVPGILEHGILHGSTTTFAWEDEMWVTQEIAELTM